MKKSNASTARSYPNHVLVGVSAMCWKNDDVLLIRRGNEPYSGCWSLPGGLINLGESLEDAALRELKEETSVNARIVGHIETFDSISVDEDGKVSHHYVLSVYEADYLSGEPVAGDDAADAEWFALNRLSELDLTPGTEDRITRNHEDRLIRLKSRFSD